jgi:hypothetical protein
MRKKRGKKKEKKKIYIYIYCMFSESGVADT